MADLIAASSLTGASDLITELGGDADELFARVHLDRSVEGSHDQFIPISTVATLIAMCARDFDTPEFALMLAGRQDADILGPLAIVARTASTVGEALAEISRYAHVYSPAIATEVAVSATEVSYEFRTTLRRLPFREHIVELALGVSLTTFRALGGDELRPSRVAVAHPPLASPQTYRNHFDCPVEFDHGLNTLIYPRGIMARRLPDIDPLVRDLAVKFMAGRDRADSFPDAVSSVIRRSLPAGAASLDRVAELMMLHPRALQRQLAESGVTFEGLVDATRREVAESLLSSRAVPLSTIARHLGYSEQSTLTRSSRRWFGMPPLAKRRELSKP